MANALAWLRKTVGSLATVEATVPDWRPALWYSSVDVYGGYTHSYATIYRTQPNVRTTIDFLARNIAQLGLHVYRRVSDTDRERLTDHPLARLIRQPNAWTTRYRLIETIVIDLGIYWNAYLVKIKPRDAAPFLVRVDPRLVTVDGKLSPSKYLVNFGGSKVMELDPPDVVHFRGYSPESDVQGLSPLETLRRILAEEAAAGEHREGFWRNAARMSGVIERPADAPEWSDAALRRFQVQFEALYSGAQNAGRTAVLEDGMSYKANSFSPEDSQYLEGRQLTREEVARAYHVPPPMVGILNNATYANVTEQHKMLYQDTLGPWLVMLEEELELQLLPEFDTSGSVYLEFNIAEKLKGSFEERAASISSAVGRPWLTANEARALDNRNALDGDADALVTPLNVLVGGQASPRDSAPPPKALHGAKARVDTLFVRLRARHVAKWRQVLETFFDRQRQVVLPRLAKASVETIFDRRRWDRELGDELFGLLLGTAEAFALRVAGELAGEFDAERIRAYLAEGARIAAEGINATTRAKLAAALEEPEPRDAVRAMFAWMRASRAAQIAETKVTAAANFGGHEAAQQAAATTKTWVVNSQNPRSQHAALAGETVGLDETFSNGLKWPGDGERGDAEELANCLCSVEFSTRRR